MFVLGDAVTADPRRASPPASFVAAASDAEHLAIQLKLVDLEVLASGEPRQRRLGADSV